MHELELYAVYTGIVYEKIHWVLTHEKQNKNQPTTTS